MAINYTRMRALVTRLIPENGRVVSIRDKGISNHDPVEGTVDSTPVDVVADAVFTSITQENKPEGEILAGDKWCVITEEVVKDDLIVDGSDVWQVVWVDEKYPGPIKLVWKVHVRK